LDIDYPRKLGVFDHFERNVRKQETRPKDMILEEI
jgi:hypothetical protein